MAAWAFLMQTMPRSSGIMKPTQLQICPVKIRIETELPIRPTEKCRHSGAHPIYRRTLSSSIAIEDLATLPGSSEMLGLLSRKLLLIKLDGGGRSLQRTRSLAAFPCKQGI